MHRQFVVFGPKVAGDLAGPSETPEQTLDLQRCLLRLPPEQREVLLLVTLQDLRYEDVARMTGVPLGTVMSRLSRAQPIVPSSASESSLNCSTYCT